MTGSFNLDSFVKTRIASRKGAKHAKKTSEIKLSDLAFLASLREKFPFATRSTLRRTQKEANSELNKYLIAGRRAM
jgi:hypothetical protein